MLLQIDNACTMLAVVILAAIVLMDMQRTSTLRGMARKHEGRCGEAVDCDEGAAKGGGGKAETKVTPDASPSTDPTPPVGDDIVSARTAGVIDDEAATATPAASGATVAPGATPSMSASERKSGIQNALLAAAAPALESPTNAGTLGVSGLMQSVQTLTCGNACGAPPMPSASSLVFNAPPHLPAEAITGI